MRAHVRNMYFLIISANGKPDWPSGATDRHVVAAVVLLCWAFALGALLTALVDVPEARVGRTA